MSISKLSFPALPLIPPPTTIYTALQRAYLAELNR